MLVFLRRHTQLKQNRFATDGQVLLPRSNVHVVDVRQHLSHPERALLDDN